MYVRILPLAKLALFKTYFEVMKFEKTCNPCPDFLLFAIYAPVSLEDPQVVSFIQESRGLIIRFPFYFIYAVH